MKTNVRIGILSGSERVADAFCHGSKHLFDLAGGNIGNFAIIHSIYSHACAASNNVRIVSWSTPTEVLQSDFDLVVFACANMLGPHTDLGPMADKLESLNVPIIAIGLGAQADDMTKPTEIPPGTRRWLNAIVSRAPSSEPNIGVRGQYTLDQLERIGLGRHATVIGCPSNLITPNKELGETLEKRASVARFGRIAVAAGLPYWPQLESLERELVKLVESSDGVYIAQHDLDVVRLCRDEANDIPPDRLAHIQRYLAPHKTVDELLAWARRYGACYVDAASWMDAMRKFDFVIGPRFHGIMLGLQAGTPGLVLTHDSRTQELCATMCIPNVHFTAWQGPVDQETIRSKHKFDAAAYKATRAMLCRRYLDLFQCAGLPLPPALVRIAKG